MYRLKRLLTVAVTCMILFGIEWKLADLPKSLDNTTRIIIITYMRSGSTFTGSLYEHNPDVFYAFEPVKGLFESSNKKLSFLYKSARSKRGYKTEASDVIKATTDCRFEDLDIESLSHYHLKNSRDTFPYWRCIKSQTQNPTRADILRCINLIQEPCKSSKARVVKAIRLPMESMESILESSQSVKMIHLLRDPRASIRSQMMYGNSPSPKVYPYANLTCRNLLAEITIRERLEQKYPNRIKVLFYEDLATNPMQETEGLYMFAGLQLTPDVKRYVKEITSARTSSNCLLCVHKTNSTYEAIKWRTEIAFNAAREIDDACSEVYTKLGFIPVKSEKQLRNQNLPLRKSLHE